MGQVSISYGHNMANIRTKLKEERVVTLVGLGYTGYDKINAALKKEFGSGLRKQRVQGIVRSALDRTKKVDFEKNVPKKYLPTDRMDDPKYIIFFMNEVTRQNDYSQLLDAVYKKALKMSKEELKRRIDEGGKRQEGNKLNSATPTGTLIVNIEVNYTSSEDNAVRTVLIRKRQSSTIDSRIFKLSRKKEIAAFLYTLQTVLDTNVKSLVHLI